MYEFLYEVRCIAEKHLNGDVDGPSDAGSNGAAVNQSATSLLDTNFKFYINRLVVIYMDG